jgi:hypothetical protein
VIPALLLAATLAVAPAPRLGADVNITQATRGPVVGVLASVHVQADVDGDVIALGGDVVVDAPARVDGDVVAMGGRVSGAGVATGRTVSMATLDAVAFPPLNGSGSVRAAWGMRLVRVGGWMVLATVLLLLWPRQARRGGEHLRTRPLRTLVVGVLSLGVWLVLVLMALALAASRAGIVLLLAGVVVLLTAKLLGLLAVAWLLGVWLRASLPAAWRGEIPRTGLGMALLAVAGMLPLLGPALWLAANVAGVGAMVAAVAAPRLLTLALTTNGPASA